CDRSCPLISIPSQNVPVAKRIPLLFVNDEITPSWDDPECCRVISNSLEYSERCSLTLFKSSLLVNSTRHLPLVNSDNLIMYSDTPSKYDSLFCVGLGISSAINNRAFSLYGNGDDSISPLNPYSSSNPMLFFI